MDMEFTPPERFGAPPSVDDPDFIAACIATVDTSAALRAELPNGARTRTDPPVEVATYTGGRRKVESREGPANLATSEPAHEVESPPLSMVPVAPSSDRSDLAEARRREVQARADLQSLWEEFNHLKQRHDETATELKAVLPREAQARAELAQAMPLIAEHKSAAEELRGVIAARDQEIRELQQYLVAAEEGRVADTAARLRQDDDRAKKLEAAVQSDAQAREQLAKAMSVIADHKSAAERLHLVITARDQEIDELRQRLLDAEEARVTDATAFLESLSKNRG